MLTRKFVLHTELGAWHTWWSDMHAWHGVSAADILLQELTKPSDKLQKKSDKSVEGEKCKEAARAGANAGFGFEIYGKLETHEARFVAGATEQKTEEKQNMEPKVTEQFMEKKGEEIEAVVSKGKAEEDKKIYDKSKVHVMSPNKQREDIVYVCKQTFGFNAGKAEEGGGGPEGCGQGRGDRRGFHSCEARCP